MWGLPSALGIFAVGFDYARYLAWISFLKLLSTVVGGAANFFEKLIQAKPRESVSSDGEKFELPDVDEESVFLEEEEEEEEELKPPPKVNPLNLVLSDDILPEILKHLDADSLKSSRLVSRHWCQLATPILASKAAVHLYTVDKYTYFGDDFDPPSCSFNLEKSRPVNHFKNFLSWRDSKEEASDRRLISYKHFKLTFASWLVEPSAIFPQNMRLFVTPRVQESLVSLTVQGRYLGWLRFALGNLPHLKSLKLEIDWYRGEGNFAGHAAEDDLDLEPGNLPVLPKLEELTVVQQKNFFDEPQWHWIFAASHQLSSLDLTFAVESDLLSSLENLLRFYRGCGLLRLSCTLKLIADYNHLFRDSSRLVLVLHQILSSDRISRGLKHFSCDAFMTPHDWAGVFRTTKTNWPMGSPLESLRLNIFTSSSRAEFVNDFLMFCPTFSGEAYFRRLKYLKLLVFDNFSVRESSPEPIPMLKSSRTFSELETLHFFYVSNVAPYQQLSPHFFKPFPNLKTLETYVNTLKCVTTIFRHMPLGLQYLSLECAYTFLVKLNEDFADYDLQSTQLSLKPQRYEVTDDNALRCFGVVSEAEYEEWLEDRRIT